MIYGSQYYRPPFPYRGCWENDLDNMVSLGFNTVKLWAVWNWIEREPGVFQFDDLDALTALCGCWSQVDAAEAASLGADVLFGTGDRQGFVRAVETAAAERRA